MSILVIDRDTMNTQLMRSKYETLGLEVVEETNKNDAIDRLKSENYSTVYFDPSPLNNAGPTVSQMRRAMTEYGYIVLLSKGIDLDGAFKSGANDLLSKPLDASRIEEIESNSEYLRDLVFRLGDEREDFPSAGGVIAKSAVNQLFLSAMERGMRYGERSYALFIKINNFQEVEALDGPQAASFASAKLSQYLARYRRQSDIIAQTGKDEYCLMLQRPTQEDEPIEAAKRFAESLMKLEKMTENDDVEIIISVSLVMLPKGDRQAQYEVSFDKTGAKNIVNLKTA